MDLILTEPGNQENWIMLGQGVFFCAFGFLLFA